MDNRTPEDFNRSVQGDGTEPPQVQEPRTNFISKWVETLTNIGLGESIFRIGTTATFLILVFGVVWLLRNFYSNSLLVNEPNNAQAAESTPTPVVSLVNVPQAPIDALVGIRREANLHTIIPDRPRQEVITYEVQQGDTIFGISQKFGLNPKTILWGNYFTLLDDPHNLRVGQKLKILPVDGTIHIWSPGDGLNGVAKYFGVKTEDIINFPANHLSLDTIGDFSNPNIKVGTSLIIPGGTRQFTSWSSPIGVTRTNPGIARVLGAGFCGKITDGAVGFGSFIWPSSKHYLSGFDYSPDTNHRGIDIAGTQGEPVWATDAGVIVYAGWNDYGYGNMVMVDHGNGWQSLYGHLNSIAVVCGQSVGQGTVIGGLGSTGNSSGPHLHFELMNTSAGKVNPHDFLPAP
jgi:murein DD-endopeptidase MepM/ murein hydrolase activator NlpD